MEQNKTVDAYILKHSKYSQTLNKLRNILLATALTETVKWGAPIYTYENKNLIGIGAFKNHVGLWFFQGALLKDKYGKLKNAQEGKTVAMRQIRFENIDGIDQELILAYVIETIDNQKKGLVIKPKKKSNEVIIPKELSVVFDKDSKLENCFEELTPGRKREYIDYISTAKKEATKINRIEKIILIMKKKGSMINTRTVKQIMK